MAPAQPMSKKKGREPRMDVMTIMPPLRRPGHVSIAEYGATVGCRLVTLQMLQPPASSQGRTGKPSLPWKPKISGVKQGPRSVPLPGFQV